MPVSIRVSGFATCRDVTPIATANSARLYCSKRRASEMTGDEFIDQILDAFAPCGRLDYGENISMRAHMLQTAYLAEQNGEENRVVAAALLHDYGHLICNMPNSIFDEGRNNHHEAIGAVALEGWIDDEIAEAIRLHVDANRYLRAANPAYREKLSDASITALGIQGGPMTAQEMLEFRQQKGHKLAARIRVYDDLGKMAEMERPELAHYVPKIKYRLLVQ